MNKWRLQEDDLLFASMKTVHKQSIGVREIPIWAIIIR
jgi:hypothetical protein